MTIYFVTNGINRMAGTERVIVQLAQALEDVIILVPGSKQCAFSGCENLNIQSLEVGEFPTHNKLAKIIHRLNYFRKLKSILRRNDTVVSFSFDLNLVNIKLSKILNYTPIVCEHIEYNYHKGFRNLIRKKFYSQDTVTLVCLTETDKRKFLNDGIRTLVIPNFIHPLNSKYNSESKKILSIGRLEFQKNFAFLIEAFHLSKIYENGWVLDIVGEGSEQKELEEKIKLLNMNEFIRIHPFTKNISKYYQDSALMCMTSRFEAFPMVLLEAMNNSLPVLVSDFPTGAREILGEGNTQIVSDYTPEAFAKLLASFCLDEDLRKTLSKQNSELIRKYYPEQIIQLWKELLEHKSKE